MAWDSLLKIYYKNQNQPEVLASIYRERFASPFAKHVDFAIRQYNRPTSWPAFYYYTDEIIELLVNINKENGVLQQMKHAMPDIGLKSFYISSMMDEIISTNDIENVNSTKREISLALDKLKNKHSNVRLSHVVSKYKKLIKKEVVYFDYIKKQNSELTNSEISSIVNSALKWSDEFNIDEKMSLAIMTVESSFNKHAISNAGAFGLMQLMPATGARFGVSSAERGDPAKNVRAGVRYLREEEIE